MSQRVVIGFAALVALLAGLYVALYIAPPKVTEPEYLQLYPQVRQIPPFEVFDQQGEVFSNAQLQGHWTLAFVGYTFCPDICPTTLAELNRVYPQLQKHQTDEPVQIWFLSVDPARDTQARLKEYIQFFNSEFIATSAPHKVLFPLVRSMGMMYSMSGDTTQDNYLVDHSASVIVINPQGQVVGRFKPHLEPGKLAVSDGEQILADMPLLMSR